jgi:glucan biosynthesis protein C
MNDQLSEKKQKLAELRAKQRSSLASISKKSVSNKEKVSISSIEEPTSVRFHGLDLLRAMAMLMGLIFHAPMLYYIPIMADGFQDFGVSSATMPPMEAWLSATVYWLHSWRMTVFFMISGFFTALVISRHTPKEFIKDKFIKLAVTMLIFAALFDMLDGRFDAKLEHMWFLYYLFLFSCITWVFIQLKPPSRQAEVNQNQTKAIAKFLIIALVLVCLRPICDLIDGGHVGVASHYHTIKLGGFLYFLSWFITGAWLYKNRFLLISANSKVLTFLCLLAAVSIFYILLPNLSGIWGYGAVDAETKAKAIQISLLKGLNAVLWGVFFTLFTHQAIKKSNKLLEWLVTLSFPIYIFHLVPCMVLSAILIGMGLPQFQVLIGAVIGAFIVSVVLYYLFIKFTPLSWIILGYKKSWLQPFKNRASL